MKIVELTPRSADRGELVGKARLPCGLCVSAMSLFRSNPDILSGDSPLFRLDETGWEVEKKKKHSEK